MHLIRAQGILMSLVEALRVLIGLVGAGALGKLIGLVEALGGLIRALRVFLV